MQKRKQQPRIREDLDLLAIGPALSIKPAGPEVTRRGDDCGNDLWDEPTAEMSLLLPHF
jgi:hypothetical protein